MVEAVVDCSKVVAHLVEGLKLPFDTTDVEGQEVVDLSCSELWAVELGWSREAPGLKKIAVVCPDKLTARMVADTLLSLRLANRQITCVDEAMYQYGKLEELTLTGNYISSLSINCLPVSLKILELCYNQLSCLDGLNKRSSVCLQHLGVAYNRLQQISLTPVYWSGLVSLDLSHNSLTDLPSVVDNLLQLKMMKSLSLMGNPLALVQCYRAYVIDSLSGLSYLDDGEILAREREEVSSIKAYCSNHPDMVRCAVMEFQLGSITHLTSSIEDKELADQQTSRLFLVASHSFLKQSSFDILAAPTSADEEQSPSMTPSIVAAICTDTTQDELSVPTNPMLLDTGTKFDNTLYCISALSGLDALLRQGIKVKLFMKRAVFSPDEKDQPGKGGKTLVAEAKLKGGAKSGRSTAQSGRSTANKKQEKKATKPAKGKMQPPAEMPGQGWHISLVESILLATFHFETADLAAGAANTMEVPAVAEMTNVDSRFLEWCKFDEGSSEFKISCNLALTVKKLTSIPSYM